MPNDDRVLLLAGSQLTGQQGADGLFEARLSGEVNFLGLEKKGGIRYAPVVDAENPEHIYVATAADGVWASTDAGRTWSERNRGLTFKETWSIVQQAATGDIYVGTGPAAIFKSSDRGETWRECRKMRMMGTVRDWTFPGPPFLAHVKGLTVSTDDPDLVFGAVEEGWLVRSQDRGETWENIKDGTEFDSHDVRLIPGDPQVVVSISGTGVYRSKDGGGSFSEANTGLDRRYMVGLVSHPDRPQRFFTTAAEVPPPFWRRPEGASAAFYTSDDAGENWQKITGGVPEYFHAASRSIAGDPVDPDTYYVGMTDGTLWMSDDAGESFRQVLDGLPPISGISVSYR